ncbi:MAG: leucine-rich repeat domain-containing protein, partial [Dysgonamonadaceae bacterium]|nr:leucine-rich repeat domain-containing protein [Dysgonamonadaceae bacterium]
MKKILLIMVLCTVIIPPARGEYGYWSWSYWYCPVSYSEARVYFQVWWGTAGSNVYVAGEGPLPDSNEGNTKEFPFSYLYGGPYSWALPWRKGGATAEIGYKGQLDPSPASLKIVLVTVDEGITHVGSWWFAGLGYLQEAVMPWSLQSIGEGAFKSCKKLTYFECPDNVKTIGKSAFEGCNALSTFDVYDLTGNYKISEAPLNIGNRAFADCGSLKNLKITANSTLGDEVFKGSGLESVDLGNNVKFGSNVFQDCKNFKHFTVSAASTLGDCALANSSLETVTVNDNVTFGKYTFQNCKNL